MGNKFKTDLKMEKKEIIQKYVDANKKSEEALNDMEKEIISLLKANNLTQFNFIENVNWDTDFSEVEEYHFGWEEDYDNDTDKEFYEWYCDEAVQVDCKDFYTNEMEDGFICLVEVSDKDTLVVRGMDKYGCLYYQVDMKYTFQTALDIYEKLEKELNNTNK